MTSTKAALLITVVVLLATVAGVLVLMNKSTKMPATGLPAQAVEDGNAVIRYLPLGDSYTIGQGVAEAERWPNQVVAQYQPSGQRLRIVGNPAVTGYTSRDLIDRQLDLVSTLHPDFVTVQIGVNDQVQGVTVESFEQNLRQIIDQLQRQLPDQGNILLVTIPDYGTTPAGKQFGDPERIAMDIQRFNQVIEMISAEAGLPVADVYAISRQASTDPTLTAADGLHPSGRQYSLWAREIIRVLQAAEIPR